MTDARPKRVLVTGATGFVAAALIPLLRERGHAVRLAVRRPGTGIEDADAVVVGDIDGMTDWRAALDGVEAVVHLAARVHVMRETEGDPQAAFRRTNVDGTRVLAEAAEKAGVGRFVFLSSVKAVAEHSGDGRLTDEATPSPETPYGQSKLEAETALNGIAHRSGMTAVIIRPPLIYGPGVKGNMLSLLGLCWRRLPLPLGAVDNRRSLLYVGNLADAIERAISHEGAATGAYFLHDGPPVSTPDLIRRIGTALGRRGPLLPVPVTALRAAGRALGRQDLVDRLTQSLALDDSGFRATFTWHPRHSPEEGVASTAEWYRRLHGGSPTP